MIESLVLRNTVLDTSININKTVGEYWLDEVDFGQAEGVAHTFKFINQIGETVYDIGIDPRQILITGWVGGWNQAYVSIQKEALNRFVNPMHLLECIVNGKKIQFYPRTSVKYSTTHKENNEYMSKFLITGYCAYPLFTDEYEHFVSVAYTQSMWRFPWAIPRTGFIFGIRHPSLIAEVTNEGDFSIGYTIEFVAKGKVINPSLIDIGAQKQIKIEKELTNGETVSVNTREGYRQVIGTLNEETSNYFKYRTYDSDWLELSPGINYLRFTADEGENFLEVNIRFNPAFLEADR